MAWNELKPQGTDLLSELPSVMTTNALVFRQAIEKHSFWTDTSGISAGIPRLSDGSAGPGSARAFFAPLSSLSTALGDTKPLSGRLFIASDTSQLFAFTSTGTVQLGGKNSIVLIGPSIQTIPSNTRVLVQIGSLSQQTGGQQVNFPVAYNAIPTVQLTVISSGTTYFGAVSAATINASGFSTRLGMVYGSNSSMTILWRSHGTVAL